jgi:hypothetical protein
VFEAGGDRVFDAMPAYVQIRRAADGTKAGDKSLNRGLTTVINGAVLS